MLTTVRLFIMHLSRKTAHLGCGPLASFLTEAGSVECFSSERGYVTAMNSIFLSLSCLLFHALATLVTSTLMPLEILSQTINEPTPRHIIICVDGVGISTISKMRAEGRFRRFQSPSHMISTFPSLTNPAFSEILGPAGARPTRAMKTSSST